MVCGAFLNLNILRYCLLCIAINGHHYIFLNSETVFSYGYNFASQINHIKLNKPLIYKLGHKNNGKEAI